MINLFFFHCDPTTVVSPWHLLKENTLFLKSFLLKNKCTEAIISINCMCNPFFNKLTGRTKYDHQTSTLSWTKNYTLALTTINMHAYTVGSCWDTCIKYVCGLA